MATKLCLGPSEPEAPTTVRTDQLGLAPYEDTPYELIKDIKPDLIVKGGDYTVETVVGHDLAPVHLVPTIEGYSTTNIIEASK